MEARPTLKALFAWVASARLAGRASSEFGRALKLRKAGKPSEAYGVAEVALRHLREGRSPSELPWEDSVFVGLTMLLEELAQELGKNGVSLDDLRHTIKFLSSLPLSARGSVTDLREQWLPYLEARVAQHTEGSSAS